MGIDLKAGQVAVVEACLVFVREKHPGYRIGEMRILNPPPEGAYAVYLTLEGLDREDHESPWRHKQLEVEFGGGTTIAYYDEHGQRRRVDVEHTAPHRLAAELNLQSDRVARTY